MSVEVPEGWTKRSLGELSSFQNGAAFKPEDWSQDGKPIIRIQNLNGGSEFNYFAGELDRKFLVQDGDLLFCWSGSRGTSFGPRYWRGVEGWLNQHIFNCQPSSLVSKEYLYFLLDQLTTEIEAQAHGGAGLVHIKKSELTKFEYGLPPLPEQQRIAEILSSVDESIRATEAVIAQAERVKRGLMEDLLTGGLGSAAIANGEVPEGWKTYTLEEVIQIDWGDTNITKKSYVDDGFVAYSAAGGDGFLPHFDHDREGIVVSAIGANSGRMFWAEGRWSAIKNTMVAFPKSSYINLKFFFYYAQQQDFWPISGGAQPFIGLKNARMARLVIPDAMQQDAAVRAISSVDDQITSNRATVEQLQRLKRGLMDDLLTGKVRTVA